MSPKQFATVVVITFIVGIIWLVSDIIFNTKASIPDNPQLNTLLEPINPNFDSRILDLIAKEVPNTETIPVTHKSAPATPVPETNSPAATKGGQLRP